MPQTTSVARIRIKRAVNGLLGTGVAVFSLAIIALGIETLFCARYSELVESFGAQYKIIPVIPLLPQIPWLAYAFGALLTASGLALFSKRTARTGALTIGSLMLLGAVFLYAPKYVGHWSAMSVPERTSIFEPLALAALVWLLPEVNAMPGWLMRGSRYLLAVSFIVFGLDHFLALAFLATLIPNWISWHFFWIVFFGAAFIAAGISVALNLLFRHACALIGLMFAIWVFTLHLPRVIKAPHDPDEWSSLWIAVALWGGSWALARAKSKHEAPAAYAAGGCHRY